MYRIYSYKQTFQLLHVSICCLSIYVLDLCIYTNSNHPHTIGTATRFNAVTLKNNIHRCRIPAKWLPQLHRCIFWMYRIMRIYTNFQYRALSLLLSHTSHHNKHEKCQIEYSSTTIRVIVTVNACGWFYVDSENSIDVYY